MKVSTLKNSFSVLIILFFYFSIFPIVSFAQTQNTFSGIVPNCGSALDPNGECNFNSVVDTARTVANEIFIIGMALAPIILAYVGYLLVTSGDKPDKRSQAKKIAWNVVIGIVIMMLAWLFVTLILNGLLNKKTLDTIPLK
jgi:hypothetical protein